MVAEPILICSLGSGSPEAGLSHTDYIHLSEHRVTCCNFFSTTHDFHRCTSTSHTKYTPLATKKPKTQIQGCAVKFSYHWWASTITTTETTTICKAGQGRVGDLPTGRLTASLWILECEREIRSPFFPPPKFDSLLAHSCSGRAFPCMPLPFSL